MVKIATWNVNSIKARLPHVLRWLQEASPDVVLLQELKCVDEAFPFLEIEALGYRCEVHGQKTYNGVAILSRLPVADVQRGLPDLDGSPCPDDPQARYIQARIADRITIASLYLPNGNPVDTEKFPYKLSWMDRLNRHAQRLFARNEMTVLAGDYNICPTDEDVYDPIGWRDDALCRPESRQRFWSLRHAGWTDAYRALNREPNRYSFWDYQAGAWPKDRGVRIDHLLLSPLAADRLMASGIDRKPRGEEKASDHTPVWCSIDF
ncbi:exodeoxyribonuclease III [Insolitispirillum peregrinum]|uniref:Exodeoxyribonuclease-3 n=1 Tax=Insolitispirillum peregrinum TaxID=80876 RepID=A0A1N7ITF2_9PROT|nr:exodeoxyribonuclease III [Insolitispirillum peregrinum]SIS40320.1 exodeoxyribonuclease-3 [Insolitispirillum peregrinum]